MTATNLIPLLFLSIPIAILGSFLFMIVRLIYLWSWNNKQPIRTDQATVVRKKRQVSAINEGAMSTNYWVTFELGSGQRRTVRVTRSEFGDLNEGDEGEYTHQGTRYLRFARIILDRGGRM